MDLAAIRSACFSTPIPSPSRRMLAPSSPVARVSLRRCRRPSDRSFALRRRNRCSACGGAETLVAGTQREEASSHASTKKQRSEAEAADLKSWLHSQGLPPCKVVLKEKAPHPHEGKHRPIHYVAASEDLQAGDVAFSVPNSLIVTLERVLGDETIAELLTTNKLSELACLALYLIYEKKQGRKSFWYPFIRELDRQRGRGQLAVESPILWSESELAYLTGSPTRAEVLKRDEGIKREYNELDTVWFMAGSLFKVFFRTGSG
uniref:Protein SET DOMAIN GROUP 40 n=1 Tax=Anthurium amnicola TaxID=1678845 RepID=A0A1D1YNU9_9ARAE